MNILVIRKIRTFGIALTLFETDKTIVLKVLADAWQAYKTKPRRIDFQIAEPKLPIARHQGAVEKCVLRLLAVWQICIDNQLVN